MKLAVGKAKPVRHLLNKHPKSLTYRIRLIFSFLLFKAAMQINTALVTFQMTPGPSYIVGRHMKEGF